jgi:hypothetical protein
MPAGQLGLWEPSQGCLMKMKKRTAFDLFAAFGAAILLASMTLVAWVSSKALLTVFLAVMTLFATITCFNQWRHPRQG